MKKTSILIAFMALSLFATAQKAVTQAPVPAQNVQQRMPPPDSATCVQIINILQNASQTMNELRIALKVSQGNDNAFKTSQPAQQDLYNLTNLFELMRKQFVTDYAMQHAPAKK